MIDGLNSKRPQKRAWAARLLGQNGQLPEDVLARLRELLNDSQLVVQAASADALSRSSDLQALPTLIRLSATNALQTDIAQALGRYQNTDAFEALYLVASSPTTATKARQIAAQQLALHARLTETPLLQQLLKSDELRIARLAQAGLKRLNP